MINRQRTNRRRKSGIHLTNQTLLLLTGILSVVLVALLFVGVYVTKGNTPGQTTDPLLNSEGVTNPTGETQDTGNTVPTETTMPTEPQQTEPPAPTLPVTPEGENYINVGSGYIAEIILDNAETFDGKTLDDYSIPTNNYLPKGTVDYCSAQPVYSANGKVAYVQLRSGHRMYVERKIYPPVEIVEVTNQYAGELPDHNEISVVSFEDLGRHTVLTLDCLWKAPFYFNLAPQKYANPDGGSGRDFTISSFTATYVDITFCYATAFRGNVEIPAGNLIFKSAELIQNESDCTLRLYLRKTGSFYGWHAYYNDQDQLCFQFLNPAKVTKATNAYGVNLTGTKIMIDVGHGGLDGGAVGEDATGKEWEEADLNLLLANALKKELESMGATVVMNRTGDTGMNTDVRVAGLLEAAPDYCVAVHQNTIAGYPNISGFDSMFYTPFSYMAAQKVYQRVDQAGIYEKEDLKWNVYFMARQTICPVVLTENGYMSNLNDLNGMFTDETVQKKAQAIAQGIADYFLEINK